MRRGAVRGLDGGGREAQMYLKDCGYSRDRREALLYLEDRGNNGEGHGAGRDSNEAGCEGQDHQFW